MFELAKLLRSIRVKVEIHAEVEVGQTVDDAPALSAEAQEFVEEEDYSFAPK